MHVDQLTSDQPDTLLTVDADRLLMEYIASDIWDQDKDLINGIAGAAIYALSHTDEHFGQSLFQIILERLEETAEKQQNGIFWRTPNSLLPDQYARLYPRGACVMGMAHGIDSLLCILGSAYLRGWHGERVFVLLSRAFEFHVSQLRSDPLIGYFPSVADLKEKTRFAWCYGDPGGLFATIFISRILEKPEFAARAIEFAVSSWRSRRHGGHGIVDSSICHGWTGVAYTYHRLFKMTEDPRLQEISKELWQRFLERECRAHLDEEIKTYDTTRGMYYKSPGFLMGEAGISLICSSISSAVIPKWDILLYGSEA